MKIFRLRQTLMLAACLAMVLSLAASWTSYAGPLTMPTSAIGNARALARDMATQARDMTKLIAKLRLEIGLVDTGGNANPPGSLADKIAEANDIITTCGMSCTAQDVNDAALLISRALQEADLFIELKIGLLLSEAEQLSEDDGSLKGKLQSLVTDGKIRSTPGNSAINKTDVIDDLLQDFVREVGEIRDLIEDGDEGEGSACDQTLMSPHDDDCDDIEDWLGIFLDDPVNNTDALDQALLLIAEIQSDLDTLLKKLTPSTPDSVLPSLIMIDKILKDEQRRGTYRRSSSVISVTLENNLAHVAIAPEVSGVIDGTVKLWAMDGHLVGEYALHGKTLTLSMGKDGLANGVYYYTASLRRADGTVAQTTVQKLVVVR